MRAGAIVSRYGIEIKLADTWKAVHPPAGPLPYSFETAAEAEALARVLYPKLMRQKREGGEELIRISAR